MQRSNLATTGLPKILKFTFAYVSKCGDLRNARKQFNLLQNTLLCDDDLIIYSAACDIDINELSISLVFQLNNPEMIGDIVKQFDEFTVYLDSISVN